MSSVQGRARLIRAAKDLHSQWLQVQESWHDEQSRHFEKKIMSPLETDICMAVQAMDRIENLLAQAQNDCRSREEY